ncbi:MAG: hypothetical protein RM338_11440 [Nostoc sp. DedQUE12a]|nr:hypothetical protein [Nostoc sp. DedQUE12a]
MASIKINDLHPIGSDLFQDPESFLNELSDRQITGVQGGLTVGTLSETLAGTLSETLGGLTAGSAAETLSGLTGGTLGLSITPL